MNIAYKHLEARLRIGELTPGQWTAVVLGLLVAVGWGMYLSPFGGYLSFFSGVYLGSIPAGAALLASAAEFDLWLLVASAYRWRRNDGRYLPGPGDDAVGYRVTSDGDSDAAGGPRRRQMLDPRSLWAS